MQLETIDGGKSFDWGRTSQDYARYRDIYPEQFYQRITDAGLCIRGQRALDIGTGTGVLPRHLYPAGAVWTGIDASAEQIAQARTLAEAAGMAIDFYATPAEDYDAPKASYDVVTACQCIWYPEHSRLAPRLARLLRKGGSFLILVMMWLPHEDQIAARSEEIILRHNPRWSGGGETRKPVWVPEEYLTYFDLTARELYDVEVPFTRESWHGRMRACRGVGASLTGDALRAWEEEHRAMLAAEAPERFSVLHYVASATLTLR